MRPMVISGMVPTVAIGTEESRRTAMNLPSPGTFVGTQLRGWAHTPCLMQTLRSGRLAPVFVVVLLGWLMLDLAATGLCCRDRWAASHPAHVTAGDASAPSPTDTAPDECFCCAYSIGTAVFPPVSQVRAVSKIEYILDAVPLTVVSPPYHPPQSRS